MAQSTMRQMPRMEYATLRAVAMKLSGRELRMLIEAMDDYDWPAEDMWVWEHLLSRLRTAIGRINYGATEEP